MIRSPGSCTAQDLTRHQKRVRRLILLGGAGGNDPRGTRPAESALAVRRPHFRGPAVNLQPTQLIMNRGLSIGLLIVGVVLLVWGFNASESVASDVSTAVTGAPTDRSIWLIVLGGLGVAIGGFGLIRRSSS